MSLKIGLTEERVLVELLIPGDTENTLQIGLTPDQAYKIAQSMIFMAYTLEDILKEKAQNEPED
jgi:hypothetical protein